MIRSSNIFLVVVSALTVFAHASMAAPILPAARNMEDNVMSLGKVKQVEIVVRRLPPELRAAGLDENDIKARWTKRLTEEHFEVAEGKGYPRLSLRSVSTTDPDVPNGVAYVLVMSFDQPVRIERLDQTLFLPTYSETLLGQETRDHLGHAAILNVNRAVDLFIDGVKKANAGIAEERGAATP